MSTQKPTYANLMAVLGFSCKDRPDICDENASCQKIKIKRKNYHVCQCNNGYIGNGIDCIDKSIDCKTVCCNENAENYLKSYCKCPNDKYNCCDNCQEINIHSSCSAKARISKTFGLYENIGPDENGWSVFQGSSMYPGGPGLALKHDAVEKVVKYGTP